MPELTIFNKLSKATLQNRIDKYFRDAEKKKKEKSLSGLAYAIGCTRKNLTDYKHTDEFGEILEQAKLRCEIELEEKMQRGMPPTGIIFVLKNGYGWKDKVETDVNFTGKISLGSLFDQAQKQKAITGKREDIVDGEIIETELEENLFDHEDLPEDIF